MNKMALAISLALCVGISSAHESTHEDAGRKETPGITSASDAISPQFSPSLQQAQTSSAAVVQQTINEEKNQQRTRSQFVYEPNLAPGLYTYIVELHAPSVVDKPELKSALNQYAGRRLNISTERSQKDLKEHLSYLKRYQQEFIANASSMIDAQSAQPIMQYQFALNGMALRLSQDQAARLADAKQVKKISRETIYTTTTDQGPTLIGAPRLWQGEIGNLSQTQGEGMVIGIIDSGVNTDHPSFAEISGDGYVHTNPLGDGVYLGDCARGFPQLCNNKLIGVYSYSTITSNYSDTEVFPPNLARNGEDYGGHGSHVAAIAAGNVLNNVPETLPTPGQIESDGTPTGFTFEQISGVAPRANIISYQACFGGRSDQDDTYADCPGSAIIASIEDAIQDGVDVINFSISGGGDPWRDSTERAFLSARGAGIFVATSAGNSGPRASSSEKHSPWYTTVAYSEHGRQNAFVKQLTNFSGGNNPPSAITGQSNTGAITAPIVYAGDFTNPNDPSGDSAQCLQPFPANTFSGQIVVCDRGEIARVEKAANVASGGAGGYVLANVQGGETFLANDVYAVPGIHINADSGDRLKTWLASGANHRASITAGVAAQNIDEARVDVLASSSSRGPNTTISTLAPTLTAPGVDIYSAYADQRFGHDGHVASAGDFNYLSGSSMSSPHVAGAAALLKALNPTWTPDNIRSALAMTAVTSVLRQDASTSANYFDMGSGRIQVDRAAQTGLLLNETPSNYISAEPARGGDPRQLNLPSITDNQCVAICTWTRTFTATKDGVWDVSAQSFDDGLSISVQPQQFSILAGQSQTIEVSINGIEADKNRYVFGRVDLSAANSPDLHLPVSIVSSIGDIPTQVNTQATRDNDSVLIEDIDAITLDSFVLSPYALVKANKVSGTIQEDSDTSDYLDDRNDGVLITEITAAPGAKRLVVEILSSTAPDLDLFLAYDRNNDGILSGFEEIAQSTSSNSVEEIALNYPDAGRYFIILQSFRGSSAPSDEFDLRYAVVGAEQDDSLSVDAPSSTSSEQPFNMRVFYELGDAEIGSLFYGAIEMGTSEQRRDNLGLIDVEIERVANDVAINAASSRVDVGDTVDISVVVAANTTNERRRYEINIQAPQGTEFVNINRTINGSVNNGILQYEVVKEAGDARASAIAFGLRINDSSTPGPLPIVLTSEVINKPGNTVQRSPVFEQIQIEGAPSISFNGETTITLNVFGGQTLTIPLQLNDPNNDDVTLTFTQTAGPDTIINQSTDSINLTAPRVDEDVQLIYTVTADDGNGNLVSADFSVNVIVNQPPSIDEISAPASASGGQRITISVSASDPESDALEITINGVQGANFSTNTPRSGNSVTYNISVSDGINTVTDQVTVSLTQAPINSGSDGGGSLPVWWLLAISLIAGLRCLTGRVGLAAPAPRGLAKSLKSPRY
ncbi:S8 family serine peptidase [Glaciecola siphonariae]|uniref:S8 family serine peptidase n=1 Tax=Glaciecola siphonariae TaxID=521012 RepID=A0ABV9LSY7_9ALTE